MTELPPPAVPAPLDAPIAAIEGDTHAHYLTRVQTLADQLGYRIVFCDTRPADGKCFRDAKRIEICDQLTPNGQLAAAVHELGHALVGLANNGPRLSYAEEELIVESVAWSACQTLGLVTDANSIPYLASWAENADLTVLERAATLTGQLADRIETALLDQPETHQPEPHSA